MARVNHSVKDAREAAGVSQRELASRTGISQATLSRIEAGEREALPGERTLIDVALADNGAAPADTPSRPRRSSAVRRAYVCRKCSPTPTRVFLTGNAEAPAICPQHGPMTWQPNAPYMGQPTPVHPDDPQYA